MPKDKRTCAECRWWKQHLEGETFPGYGECTAVGIDSMCAVRERGGDAPSEKVIVDMFDDPYVVARLVTHPTHYCEMWAIKRADENRYTDHGEFMEVELTQGQTALIDHSDYELVSRFKWYALQSNKGFYAYAGSGRGRSLKRHIGMHQLIGGKGCDHKNRNGLDNRRSNLRDATPSQQQMNRGIVRSNTSGYPGVRQEKRTGKWVARITRDSKEIHLGTFRTFEDAVATRRVAEIEHFGDFRAMKEDENG